MPLNNKKGREQQQYSRPTAEQIEIALLEQQLHHCQNTNVYLNNYIDRLVNQQDEINNAIRLHNTGERSAGITLDTIKAVLR